MLRPLAVALLTLMPLSGCTQDPSAPTTAPATHPHCDELPFSPTVLYLASDHVLADETGPAGETPGNDVRETFLAEPQPWDSSPLAAGIQVAGNVTFDLWVRIDGAAPFPAQPGSSLRFYLQFGSDLALASSGIREQGPPVAAPGTIVRINATLALPEGGFTVETGGGLRLLVVSLFAGSGATTILHGNGTPSQVRFESRCSEPREWLLQRDLAHPVILPSAQGSFAQAVPPQEDVNRLTVAFDLEEGATRLSILLRQLGNPRVKNDMDLTLLNGQGEAVYEAGSPFANETMVLWPENLEAFLPPGKYQVRVDSYSGTNYSGRLTIRMEQSEGHTH